MKQIIRSVSVPVLMLMLGMSSTTFAQGEARKPDPKRLEELRQKIEETKHQKLREQLELDDETAKKFFNLYQPAERDIQQIAKERNQELEKLNKMMNGDKTDADVDPEVAKVRELTHKIEDRQMQLDQELKSILSPRQRAKLLVFEHQFNQRVHTQVARQRWLENHPAVRDELKERVKERRELLRQWRKEKKGKKAD